CIPDAGGSRPARDLRRYQQRGYAAPYRRWQGGDHHPERPRFLAERRQQRKACPPCAYAQSDRSTADLLSDVDDLYAAGADYVTVTRLSDAHELFTVIEAADAGLLDDKRAEMDV